MMKVSGVVYMRSFGHFVRGWGYSWKDHVTVVWSQSFDAFL